MGSQRTCDFNDVFRKFDAQQADARALCQLSKAGMAFAEHRTQHLELIADARSALAVWQLKASKRGTHALL